VVNPKPLYLTFLKPLYPCLKSGTCCQRDQAAQSASAAATASRQGKYLNKVAEQEHRNIKRLTKPMLSFAIY